MKYFSTGKSINGKEQPIDNDHENYYDFEGPDDVIDNFLLNVKSKFIPSTEISVKCSFLLENVQPAPVET